MKNLYSSIIAVLLFVSSGLYAQDPHFSQYYAAPLLLNPAMTGAFDGNYRITAIYRNQWHSILKADDPTGTPAFNTFSGSADFRFDVFKHDGLGIGLVFLTDKAGAASYSSNELSISVAYSKALGRAFNHNISLGVVAGGALRSLDYNNLRFGNQFDGTGFSPTLESNENTASNHFWFPDIGVGLLYYYVDNNSFNKGRTHVYGGLSVTHVNEPNQSFYGGNSAPLYIKYAASGGVGFPIAKQFDLQPNFLFMKQGPSLETDIGTFVKYFFTSNQPNGNAFYFGPWYRIVGQDNVTAKGGIASEALILSMKVDYSSFTFGFSYDINVSSLTPATNSNGAFEISVSHIGSWAKKNKVYFCPRF